MNQKTPEILAQTWRDRAAAQERRAREAQGASFKVPRKFIQVDQLPRNAMGKVQKHLLPKP